MCTNRDSQVAISCIVEHSIDAGWLTFSWRSIQLLFDRGEHRQRECLTALPDINQFSDFFL